MMNDKSNGVGSSEERVERKSIHGRRFYLFGFYFLLSTLYSLLSFNAYASVSRVEFYRDGTLIGTDTSAPYTFSTDTTSTPNGSHSFSAKAYDSAGNITTSSMNTVNVSNNVVDPGPWVKGLGGAGSDSGLAVTTDSTGNIVVAGYFSGTVPGPVDFGGGALSSAGGEDIFLAKYSPSGAHLWSKRFGDITHDRARGVAVNSSGDILVVGEFSGAVDFGGGTLTSAGSREIFMAKFSASGTYLWSKRFGSTGDDLAYSVAFDRSGNIVMTGAFLGKVDFGGGAISSGGLDTFVVKFLGDGTYVWSKNFLSNSNDLGYGVAADSNGDVVLTGAFLGKIDFGGGVLTSAGTAGGSDIFVAKLSGANGSHLWSKRFGDSGHDHGYGVAVDSANNVLVTGQFIGTADFGGGTLNSNNGSYDVFVAKFSSSGAPLWSKGLGSSLGDFGYGIRTDQTDNILIAGMFLGSVDFGGTVLTSAGLGDIFVAKYSPAGAMVWCQGFGGSMTEYGYAVTVDSSGNVLITGSFESTADFGGQPLTSAGYTDAFLLRLNS